MLTQCRLSIQDIWSGSIVLGRVLVAAFLVYVFACVLSPLAIYPARTFILLNGQGQEDSPKQDLRRPSVVPVLQNERFPRNVTAQIRLDRPVTVVTAYYDIPSKRSSKQYLEWMGIFLPTIPCYLYVFTEERHIETLKKLRAPYLNRTKLIARPFNKLKMAKRMDMWVEQKKLDHERGHTPELYVLWNEKVAFVLEAITDNAFDSDYFLWTDSGSFRSLDQAKKLTTYPDTTTTATQLGTDKVFFLQMGQFAASERKIGENGLPQHDFQRDIRVGGGVFGGHAVAVLQYAKRFYETMELMRKNKIFIGKDQNIMSSVAMIYPNLVHLVKPARYLNGADPWFYSHYYFSKKF